MRVGIVGFGVVGKSALHFLTSDRGRQFIAGRLPSFGRQNVTIYVWDGRDLTHDEIATITAVGAYASDHLCITLGEFVEYNDLLIISPGFNLNKYKNYAHKFLCELDIFGLLFKKPVVAITGSLGKTTTTKLLGKLAGMVACKNVPPVQMVRQAHHERGGQNSVRPERAEGSPEGPNALLSGRAAVTPLVGGNIGHGMLDLLDHQATGDLAILELSSFQLEFNRSWAPDVAVWTNCFANHLDRHRTLAAYVEAKYNLLKNQTSKQVAILSFGLFSGAVGDLVAQRLKNLPSKLYVTSSVPVEGAALARIPTDNWFLVYADTGSLFVRQVSHGRLDEKKILIDLTLLPAVTYLDNWIQVVTTLWVLGVDLSSVVQGIRGQSGAFSLENEHRCEHVATVSGVDYYNDSKATVIQSTQAAVSRLAGGGRPIILILGGKSKGVDRWPLAQFLATVKEIKKVYCFGTECDVFKSVSVCLPTLEAVMLDLQKILKPGDQVLFSPSGTSFDFYKNYEHRGQVFKELVGRLSLVVRP